MRRCDIWFWGNEPTKCVVCAENVGHEWEWKKATVNNSERNTPEMELKIRGCENAENKENSSSICI